MGLPSSTVCGASDDNVRGVVDVDALPSSYSVVFSVDTNSGFGDVLSFAPASVAGGDSAPSDAFLTAAEYTWMALYASNIMPRLSSRPRRVRRIVCLRRKKGIRWVIEMVKLRQAH